MAIETMSMASEPDLIDTTLKSAHNALAETFNPNADLEVIRHQIQLVIVNLFSMVTDDIRRTRHVHYYSERVKPFINED